jgi:large repetitive protein
MSVSVTFSATGYDGYVSVTKGIVNNYPYAIKVGVRNDTTGKVIDGLRIVGSGSSWAVNTENDTGVVNGTTYTYIMTILKNSDGSALGTRTRTATPSGPAVSVSISAASTAAIGYYYSGSGSASGGTINFMGIQQTSPSSVQNQAFPGVTGGPTSSGSISFSGYPTTAGTFQFAVGASNTSGAADYKYQTVSVGNAPSFSGGFGSFTLGVNPGTRSISVTGSTATVTRSGSLPAGMTGSGSTTGYTISGTPTATGSTTFTLQASNSFRTVSQSYTITVSPPPNPSWTDTTLEDGKITKYYSRSVEANSNTTSITNVNFSPTGRGLSATVNGRFIDVAGTPTSTGNFTLTATANGSAGTTAAQLNTSFTINPLVPPVWSDNTISPSFVVGTAYSDGVSATGATSYSLASGSLPSGISLSPSTGALTGTPTAKQTYSFTLQANNDDGSITQAFSGTTSAPPIWTDQALATFVEGVSYSNGVSATSLTTPGTTYSVSSGALPFGVSLNSSTGAITGYPIAGNYSFTITATNPDGSITADFTGRVSTPPVWINNTLDSFEAGVAYDDTVTATNSPTYTRHSGSLPTGTSFSNGQITGTPTTLGQSYNFTLRATNADGFVSQTYSGSVLEEQGGRLKFYENGAWSDKLVHVYNGTSWDEARVYVFDGGSWKKSQR